MNFWVIAGVVLLISGALFMNDSFHPSARGITTSTQITSGGNTFSTTSTSTGPITTTTITVSGTSTVVNNGGMNIDPNYLAMPSVQSQLTGPHPTYIQASVGAANCTATGTGMECGTEPFNVLGSLPWCVIVQASNALNPAYCSPVPNAQVTITLDGNVVCTTTTDQNGVFTCPNLSWPANRLTYNANCDSQYVGGSTLISRGCYDTVVVSFAGNSNFAASQKSLPPILVQPGFTLVAQSLVPLPSPAFGIPGEFLLGLLLAMSGIIVVVRGTKGSILG